MKLTKFPEEFTEVVRDLARALGRLEKQQGRLARKSARQAVLRVQVRLRARLDTLYPRQKVEKLELDPPNVNYTIPQARPKPLSPAQHTVIFKRKMRRRSYAQVKDTSTVQAILEGGVGIVRPPKKSDALGVYAPAWALLATMGEPNHQRAVARVAEARRSTRVRLALLGAARLTGKLAQIGLADFVTNWKTGNLMPPVATAA
jgi:hypothetical protein